MTSRLKVQNEYNWMIDSATDYEQAAVACFGPYTSANVKKLGVKVSICSKDYSPFAGFAEAIAAFVAFL